MTEYEIADLAISNSEAIMHRVDIILSMETECKADLSYS